jgi:hypothetical protein
MAVHKVLAFAGHDGVVAAGDIVPRRDVHGLLRCLAHLVFLPGVVPTPGRKARPIPE